MGLSNAPVYNTDHTDEYDVLKVKLKVVSSQGGGEGSVALGSLRLTHMSRLGPSSRNKIINLDYTSNGCILRHIWIIIISSRLFVSITQVLLSKYFNVIGCFRMKQGDGGVNTSTTMKSKNPDLLIFHSLELLDTRWHTQNLS